LGDIEKLEKPLLIVANHTSNWDSPIIGTAMISCKLSPVYFITKDSLMTAPVLGGFLRLFGAFRAHKGEGMETSLIEPKEILENGYCVIFFPQGGRLAEFKTQEGRPGAAVLALQGGYPILPVAICGMTSVNFKDFFLRKNKVKVVIGQPFFLKNRLADDFFDLKIATKIIMGEIEALLTQKYVKRPKDSVFWLGQPRTRRRAGAILKS